ncbi:MAG: hypothetical protein PHC62_05320 [Candidatus Izemoplasmatales bacterium]|nr:hypothetical protein [Candidatus Izemoplasmatales bacterium]
MRPSKKALIYSQFEIDAILFYTAMTVFTPIILVFTYIFDIDLYMDVNKFILIVVLVNFFFILCGTIVLVLKKDHLKRQVKANYRNEFLGMIVLSGFGLLGFIVFYDYLGGDRAFIANILVVLFALVVYFLLFVGRKFFKFDYMKKK